ncbi:MAG: hypothetical protein EXX96DRAFT_571477 [Benjaminiella poitrasii]|nr:MAG: hypothetical protein EXX96DRAFT_571477 [Benjaminiella poitrasii]
MYGVKGTSTILNSVARQGVLTKQLVAPKSTAFLANLPTRQVSAGKLSYTTRNQPQYNQKQEQNETSQPHVPIAHFKQRSWSTNLKASNNHFRSFEAEISDAHILKAAKQRDARAVINAFVQSKSSTDQRKLSTQTYEAVIEAYGQLRKTNQPLTPMLDAYQDMVATGARPSSQTYALLIRSLCHRDSEVQKTIGMLRRQIARTGNEVDNLGDLENERNMEKALDLFNKAVKEKCTQDFDTELYNTLLRGLSFKGNTEDGIYIYEHLESARNARPDSATFATLLALFGTAGDLPAVHECFKEYKQLKNRLPQHDPTVVYNAFVYAHANVGDISGALDILENVMVKDKVKVSVLPYNKILRRACFEGKMETADSILARLESDANLPKPDVSTYGIILSAYSRLGNFDKAAQAYKNMLNYNVSREYGHIADYAYACTAHNMSNEALAVTKDMTARGLELDANLCQKVVMSFVNNDRMNDAVSALKDIVKMYAKDNFLNDRNPVSIMALDIALKCNDVQDALSILNMLSLYAVRPSPMVCNNIFELYQQTKSNPDQWKQVSKNMNESTFFTLYDIVFRKENTPEEFCKNVFDLLKDMHDLNLSPSASLYVRVLTRMKKYDASEYEARWEKEFAPFLPSIQDQLKKGYKPTIRLNQNVKDESNKELEQTEIPMTFESDLFSGYAVDAALSGQFDKAIDILNNKIIKQGQVPTPEAVRDIIHHSTKIGRLDTAEEVFKTVIDSFETLEGGRRHRAYQTIYNVMLVAHARKGDLTLAKVFYDKLRSHDLYPDADAYGSLLACSSNATTDESTDALAIYEEAKKHNVRPTVYFYNVIISKLSKCRKLDTVLRLFDEMKQMGVMPNSITYASLISACIRCSSENRAAYYFEEMISSPKYQPRIGAYNSMIQFYVQQKPDREKALEYYNMLKKFNLKPSAYTYKLLIEAYANIPAYDMLAAHKLLSEMSKRHGIEPTASHYATLIRSYGCLHRDVQSALAVYKEMEKAGIKADNTVYQAMLNTYIENNEMQHAEQLYNDMVKEGAESSPYIENLFITGYGAQGQVEKAEERFHKMKDDSEDGVMREPSTYEAMAKAYIENGQQVKADKVIEEMRARDFPPKVVEGVIQTVTSLSV